MHGSLIKSTDTRSAWQNWAGNVKCSPLAILYPSNEQEVAKIVLQARQEGRKIRVAGSGHSFTSLVASDDYVMSLDRMQGLISVDEAKSEATVWAGTKLKILGELLYEKGFSQENLGDIDVQSIAGATATGTHGTGDKLGIISTQIAAFTLVTGTGDIVECSPEQNPEWFEGGRVSLGTWGVVTRIKIRLLPSYKLEYVSKKQKLDETLSRLEEYNADNRHFEFYWVPYTNSVQVRFNNITDKDVKDGAFKKYINQVVIENNMARLLSAIGTTFSSTFVKINKFIGWSIPKEHKINFSHRIYASLRNVKFREMEYALPYENFADAMREVEQQIKDKRYRVFFPVECRFSKGDDIWLSPAYGRKTAYMAYHVYHKTPHDPYFKEIEETLMRYEGRPHWGKMHQRNAANLAHLYPKWNDFMRVRQQLDPDNIFLNEHLKTTFGL